jgi:hypothetical protein
VTAHNCRSALALGHQISQRAFVTSPVDEELIDLLVRREGMTTEVVLRDGRRLRVVNIAWGYDDGDAHAHVTTYVSPSVALALPTSSSPARSPP